MSLTAVTATPSGDGIVPGMAVRMSAPDHLCAGVVLGLRPRGRAEVVLTDPGDSVHCPGQVVVVATRMLTPLRGREAERQLAQAKAMTRAAAAARRPLPPERCRRGDGDVRALAEAIEARGRQAGRDLDDAVAYLSQHITAAADTVAHAIEQAAAGRAAGRRRGRWRRPR